jgi:hypothetical protein
MCTFTKLFMHVSSRNMFPTTRNLQICVHVYRPSSLLWRLINFRLFCSDDCRSWPREEKFWSDDCRSWPHEEKINNHGSWGKHAHIPDNDYWGSSVCFMSCEPIFFCNYSYVVHTVYIFNFFWPKLFFTRSWSAIIGTKQPKVNQSPQQWRRTINMHTDLQISSCWEHISTWNMHE